MAKRSPWSGLILLLFLAALPAYCGCGSNSMEAEVDGTITWKGEALHGVTVTFVPEADQSEGTPRSSGVTDNNGHYVLACANGKRGAAAGSYRVIIADGVAEPNRAGKKGERPSEPLPVPNRNVARPANPAFPSQSYNRAEMTPLRQEVASGKQTIDFKLP